MSYREDLKYRMRIIIYQDDICFGKGVAQLLKLVEDKGNLTSAYEAMNLSSSKGWKIINNAEKDLGVKLIETKIGGSDGGGSKLTEVGKELLDKYNAFLEDLEVEADRLFEKHFSID